MYKMTDDDPMPRVLRQMDKRQRDGDSLWGLFVTCCMVAVAAFVVVSLSGCAVSLSFQPASWQPAVSKAQSETLAK